MDYSKYTTEDYVNDPGFQSWVLNGDAELNPFWEGFLQENPHKCLEIEEAKVIVKALFKREYNYPIDRQEKLFHKITDTNRRLYGKHINDRNSKVSSADKSMHNPNTLSKRKIMNWKAHLAMVASVVLIACFAYLFTQESDQPSVQMVNKTNKAGERSRISLPDGSTVFLNAESSLRYDLKFSDTERRVFLEGEAFFEVTKDSLRPFTVTTGQLSTTALGTSFNIKSYPENNETQIALITGKVLVKDPISNESAILIPGEAIVSKKNIQGIKKITVNSRIITLWKDGIIHFEKTKFEEVINVLEKWYDVEFVVRNGSTQNLVCSGTFKDQYLSNVLKSIGFALGFDYEIKDKKVYVTFKQK